MKKNKYPSPSMIQTRTRLNQRFHYTRDNGKIDNWRVTPDYAPIRDDCDGYALTLLYDLSEQSWWRFWWLLSTGQAAIWYATAFNGEGHALLWYKGWWADNMEPRWYLTEDMRHIRRFPWPPPIIAVKLLVGKLLNQR